MSFWSDFKKFAFKGNALDLAVGVVIGAAFGKIVTAIVSDLVMPVVSLVLPSGDWREHGWVLRQGTEGRASVVLKYGDFMGSILDFFIVALTLFLVVSRMVKAAEARFSHSNSAAAPIVKECPYCLETIPARATRCKACTSQLEGETRTAAG
jgi:large conductance mechanosensitive channel